MIAAVVLDVFVVRTPGKATIFGKEYEGSPLTLGKSFFSLYKARVEQQQAVDLQLVKNWEQIYLSC